MEKQNEQHKQGSIPHGRRQWILLSVLMAVYDFVAVIAAYFLALWMRFDFVFSRIDTRYVESFGRFILFYAAFSVLVLFLFRLYRAGNFCSGGVRLLRSFVYSASR